MVLERLTKHAQARHDRARSSAPPTQLLARPAGDTSRASPSTCRWPPAPTSARSSTSSTTWSPPSWTTRTLWVSHLTPGRAGLAPLHPTPLVVRPRVGTVAVARRPRQLAGDRDRARRARGRARRRLRLPRPLGTQEAATSRRRVGRHVPRHGMESPPGDLSMRTRAATLARGGLDAVGFVRSPFTRSTGKSSPSSPSRRTCSRPCCSCPHGPRVPAVGEGSTYGSGMTTTTFDRVLVS